MEILMFSLDFRERKRVSNGGGARTNVIVSSDKWPSDRCYEFNSFCGAPDV